MSPTHSAAALLAAVAALFGSLADAQCECLGNNDGIPAQYRRFKRSGYGSDCSQNWDSLFSYCQGEKREKRNRSCWCDSPFCYVDRESCPNSARESAMGFETTEPLYYSYEPCDAYWRNTQQCFEDDDDFSAAEEVTDTNFIVDNRGGMRNVQGMLREQDWTTMGFSYPYHHCVIQSCLKKSDDLGLDSEGISMQGFTQNSRACTLVTATDARDGNLHHNPAWIVVEPLSIAYMRCWATGEAVESEYVQMETHAM